MRDELALARATLGLVQGTVLYLLYRADTLDPKTWPATDGLVFAPLVLVTIFVPLLAVAAIGNLRWRNLALWIVAATAVLAGLACYDILREPGGAALGQRLDR